MYTYEPEWADLTVDKRNAAIKARIREFEQAGDYRSSRELKTVLLAEISSRTDYNGILTPTPDEAAALAAEQTARDAAQAARLHRESLARDAAAVAAYDALPEVIAARKAAAAAARLAAEAARPSVPFPGSENVDPAHPLPPSGIGRN